MGKISKSEGAIVIFKNGGVSANKETVVGFEGGRLFGNKFL